MPGKKKLLLSFHCCCKLSWPLSHCVRSSQQILHQEREKFGTTPERVPVTTVLPHCSQLPASRSSPHCVLRLPQHHIDQDLQRKFPIPVKTGNGTQQLHLRDLPCPWYLEPGTGRPVTPDKDTGSHSPTRKVPKRQHDHGRVVTVPRVSQDPTWNKIHS